MVTATVSEINKELREKSQKELIQYCLRMIKFKKDNKELLNYLLFEAYDEDNFKNELKFELNQQFSELNLNSVYYAKKSLRRILRYVSKHIKYSSIKQTEVELLIYYCQQFRQLQIPFHESKVLLNLYNRQLINIQKAMNTLDEDLQFDYQSDLDEISKPLPRIWA